MGKQFQNKKILHFHYYFPPAGTVGTLRNYNIALELSDIFDESFLITVKDKAFPMEERFELDFIRKFEVTHQDYRKVSGKVLRKGDLNDRVNARRTGNTYGLSRKILDSYPGNISWGEGGYLYIKNALKLARKLIHENGITHIYSSYRPMTDHYIAYTLKKEFPELVWIADFRDLPVDRNRDNVFFPNWHDREYSRIFSKADILCTVSNGLAKRLVNYNNRIIVVRNGLRRLFLPKKPTLNNKFTITYTGSLYPKFQDPSSFFSSLKSLVKEKIIPENDIQLVYAGKDHRIWETFIKNYDLEKISRNLGKISLTESIRLQHESHVNLMMTWSGPNSGGVVTGKISEYLAARRPILCLLHGKKDAELESQAQLIPFYKLIGSKENHQIRTWIENVYNSRNADQSSGIDLNSYGWQNTIKTLVEEL